MGEQAEMIYILIGVGSTFFALLPFLFILFKLVKTQNKKTYAIGVLLFLLALVAVIAVVTYGLRGIHTDALIGESIVIGGYLVVFLWMFIVRRYKFRKRHRELLVENDEDDYEDDSYELYEDNKTVVIPPSEFDHTMIIGRDEDPGVERKQPEEVVIENKVIENTDEMNFLENLFKRSKEEASQESTMDDDIDDLTSSFK